MRRGTKIGIGIGGGVIALLVAGSAALVIGNGPLTREQVEESLTAQLRAVVDGDDSVSAAQVTVAFGQDGEIIDAVAGTTGPGRADPLSIDDPFHSASVGKTMLAVVVGQLVDEGVIGFDDRLVDHIDPALLDGLFVVDGVDHRTEVTIGQLLSHTSGVADYFEGPVVTGPTMLEIVEADPDRLFAPVDLVEFSRENQVPVGAPGERFAYSDTGFVLLGFALEQVTGAPYDQILRDRIFDPVGMTDSRLLTEFGVDTGIVGLDVGGIDLSRRNALSVDWAGGGVVTTTADLLAFLRALEGGDLLSDATRDRLMTFDHELRPGVGYGLGVFEVRFDELSPLLFTMSDARGGMGASGVLALYDPTGDTYYIANFGSLGFAEHAIEQLVQIRLTVARLER